MKFPFNLQLGLAIVALSNLGLRAQVFSSTDVWDVSQGAAVTVVSGWSKWTTENTVPNIFGADIPVLNPLDGKPWPGEAGSGFFAEDNPAGYAHWVEWTTPSPVTVTGYNLFASSDNYPAYPGARGFSSVRLLVRNSATLTYDLVDSFAPSTIDYNTVFSRSFAPVTGDYFRAEFVQTASADNGFVQGPRIYEFDAVAVPEPSTIALVSGLGLIAFAAFRRVPPCKK